MLCSQKKIRTFTRGANGFLRKKCHTHRNIWLWYKTRTEYNRLLKPNSKYHSAEKKKKRDMGAFLPREICQAVKSFTCIRETSWLKPAMTTNYNYWVVAVFHSPFRKVTVEHLNSKQERFIPHSLQPTDNTQSKLPIVSLNKRQINRINTRNSWKN
jgi:hypothetical protein